jgi:selenoprotein W-related protein
MSTTFRSWTLLSSKPTVSIDYCLACNFLLRSSWLTQELLTTFKHELSGVFLRPSDEAGCFRVKLDDQLIWDRTDIIDDTGNKRGFPDSKELKNIIRDIIAPKKDLRHSEIVK